MKNLFSTKQDVEAAINSFTNLLEHAGWKLIEDIQDANIEIAQRQLEEGLGENETKGDIERIRLKLRLFKEFKNTPRDLIKRLSEGDLEAPNYDPYETTDVDKQAKE